MARCIWMYPKPQLFGFWYIRLARILNAGMWLDGLRQLSHAFLHQLVFNPFVRTAKTLFQ
jgi:hypothetical protein